MKCFTARKEEQQGHEENQVTANVMGKISMFADVRKVQHEAVKK